MFAVAFHPLPAVVAQLLGRGGFNQRHDFVDRIGGEQPARLAVGHDILQAADAAGEDRQPRLHRLNRDQSEAANGIVLYGEADDPEDMLEADEWYPKDLIGLEARLAENNMLGLEPGVVVGKVVDVIEVAQWLLKIRLANPVKDTDGVVVENSALVPFVDELVPDIDLEKGYLTLDPPGGLIPGL